MIVHNGSTNNKKTNASLNICANVCVIHSIHSHFGVGARGRGNCGLCVILMYTCVFRLLTLSRSLSLSITLALRSARRSSSLGRQCSFRMARVFPMNRIIKRARRPSSQISPPFLCVHTHTETLTHTARHARSDARARQINE